MTFGQKLQQMRKDNDLSQETLAKLLYVTRQSISLWENDKAMPSIDLLMRIGSIFSVSVDDLIDNPTLETESQYQSIQQYIAKNFYTMLLRMKAIF